MKKQSPSGKVERATQLENKAFVEQYDEIASGMERKLRDSRITTDYMANLCCDFQEFMEKHLGADVEAPPMTKIPAFAFRDFEMKGPLHVMLKALFKRQAEVKGVDGDLLEFDFDDEAATVDLLRTMQTALINARYWLNPKIFFDRSVTGERLYRLRKLATLHGATVTHLVEEASHIVQFVPSLDDAKQTTKPVYNVIDKVGPKALIHWEKYPGSWDRWVPASIAKKPVTNFEASEPAVVSCSFIEDTHRFNEWMEDVDYELEEDDWDRTAEEVLQDLGAEMNSRHRVQALSSLAINTEELAASEATAKLQRGGAGNKTKLSATGSADDSDAPPTKKGKRSMKIRLGGLGAKKKQSNASAKGAKKPSRSSAAKRNITGLRIHLVRIDDKRYRVKSTNVVSNFVEKHGEVPVRFLDTGRELHSTVVENEKQRIFETDESTVNVRTQAYSCHCIRTLSVRGFCSVVLAAFVDTERRANVRRNFRAPPKFRRRPKVHLYALRLALMNVFSNRALTPRRQEMTIRRSNNRAVPVPNCRATNSPRQRRVHEHCWSKMIGSMR